MIQLSTREVEKVVAHVFDVPDADKLALRARLENLRKKGCPNGLVTGRGKVAKFDFGQLTDVSIALALIDAGLSPDYAVLAVEDEDGVFRQSIEQLAVQEPSAYDLASALDAGLWPVEDTVIAACCTHRLLSRPGDQAIRVATWKVNFDGSGPLSDSGISAVSIDMGTLFIRLVKAVSEVSDVDPIALATGLMGEA